MVLPVRIELTTSALPRMRSTTELRQHRADGSAPEAGAMEKASARVKAGCRWRGGRTITTPMSEKDQERERRLAEALRENLKKRKAQARGEEVSPSPAEPSAPSRSQP